MLYDIAMLLQLLYCSDMAPNASGFKAMDQERILVKILTFCSSPVMGFDSSLIHWSISKLDTMGNVGVLYSGVLKVLGTQTRVSF